VTVNGSWIGKNKGYAWQGVAVAIAGFDEQGALVIIERGAY
jgi:hypothetical protein